MTREKGVTVHVRFQEQSLLELFQDPLVRLLMSRGGATDAAMCSLFGTISERVASC
jgi:hypothetical protein